MALGGSKLKGWHTKKRSRYWPISQMHAWRGPKQTWGEHAKFTQSSSKGTLKVSTFFYEVSVLITAPPPRGNIYIFITHFICMYIKHHSTTICLKCHLPSGQDTDRYILITVWNWNKYILNQYFWLWKTEKKSSSDRCVHECMLSHIMQ